MEREKRVSQESRQRFESIHRSAVPQTRKGKHHGIVEQILQQLGGLRGKKALKISRAELGSARIEHVRAALTRASTKMKLPLATKLDDQYFYVWRQD